MIHAQPVAHRRHRARPRGSLARRSIVTGVIAGAGLVLFYVLVVAGASGSWEHLIDQSRQDWYYLVLITGGFGLQVALVAELRHRRRLHPAAAMAGGAGAGGSTAGMVACCAHHLADLVPFIGATGAAAFLIDYRIAFMLVGIGVNSLGVAVAARRLHRMAAIHECHADGTHAGNGSHASNEHEEAETCAAP